MVEAGADPGGSNDCTQAIQRAIDQCAEAGGGTILFPAGRYLTGTLWMRSNINLYLDSGAAIVGSGEVAAFPLWTSKWEGPGVKPMHAALIAGEGLENVSITGRGTLDGGGQPWWDLFRQKKLEHVRPNLIRLVDCRDVLIEGVFPDAIPLLDAEPDGLRQRDDQPDHGAQSERFAEHGWDQSGFVPQCAHIGLPH